MSLQVFSIYILINKKALQEGVMGIIDAVGGRASEYIQAQCDMLELPHVVVQQTDLISKNWSVLSMNPSPTVYNQVCIR